MLNTDNLPIISLVTPSYNQAEFLEATIESVLSQNYPNLEYIIIDGGSMDNSVDIIRRYSDHLTYWISEPDQGQTDALIKGFSRATGTIFNWLNSDDLLLPGALDAVAQAYQHNPADLIVGEDLHFIENPNKPVHHFRPANYRYPDCWRFWQGSFKYHQPCTFFSRRAYEIVGGLNIELNYVMDYDLYCRMLTLPDITVNYLSFPLSAFRLNPQAKTATAKSEFGIEQRDIIKKAWSNLSFTSKDWTEMNHYLAHCNVHNTANYLRKGYYKKAIETFVQGLQYSPLYFSKYAISRLIKSI